MRTSIIIKKHLWYIVAGTLIGGFLTEIFNQYAVTFWIYEKPWNIYFFSPFPIGISLILGWIVLTFGVLLLSSLIIKFKPQIGFFYSWIISWVVIGFISEIFNVYVWTTYIYNEPYIFTKWIIPYLNFSIFVPILGYGIITGILTYLCVRIILSLANV